MRFDLPAFQFCFESFLLVSDGATAFVFAGRRKSVAPGFAQNDRMYDTHSVRSLKFCSLFSLLLGLQISAEGLGKLWGWSVYSD